MVKQIKKKVNMNLTAVWKKIMTTFRDSRSQMFYKIGFFKKFCKNSRESTTTGVSFLIKF